MLLYDNGSNWRIILHRAGSICYRGDIVLAGAVLATISALVTFALEQGHVPQIEFNHIYGFQAIGTVVTFAVVFRTNLAWGRYWEAISQVHLMYSKFSDVYAQVLSFSSYSIEVVMRLHTTESDAKVKRIQEVSETILANLSLLSAFAADRLTHGDLSRMEHLTETARWHSIFKRDELRWNDKFAGIPVPQLQVINVEGLMTRAETNRSLHVYRSGANRFESRVYPVEGRPHEDLQPVIEDSNDRPNLFMYEVLRDLAKLSKDIEIAAPIQSRMFQELSNAMAGYNQAMKIADVPFPFPFAQTLSLILFFFSIALPVVIAVFTLNIYVAPVITFLLFNGIWGINELAKDLETPLGQSVNDMSMSDFHGRFMDACKDMHKANVVRIDRLIRERDERLAKERAEQRSIAAEAKELDATRTSDPLQVKDNAGSIRPGQNMGLQAHGAAPEQKLPSHFQPGLIDAVSEAQLVLLNARMEQHLHNISAEMARMGEQVSTVKTSRRHASSGPLLSAPGDEAAIPFSRGEAEASQASATTELTFQRRQHPNTQPEQVVQNMQPEQAFQHARGARSGA